MGTIQKFVDNLNHVLGDKKEQLTKRKGMHSLWMQEQFETMRKIILASPRDHLSEVVHIDESRSSSEAVVDQKREKRKSPEVAVGHESPETKISHSSVASSSNDLAEQAGLPGDLNKMKKEQVLAELKARGDTTMTMKASKQALIDALRELLLAESIERNKNDLLPPSSPLVSRVITQGLETKNLIISPTTLGSIRRSIVSTNTVMGTDPEGTKLAAKAEWERRNSELKSRQSQCNAVQTIDLTMSSPARTQVQISSSTPSAMVMSPTVAQGTPEQPDAMMVSPPKAIPCEFGESSDLSHPDFVADDDINLHNQQELVVQSSSSIEAELIAAISAVEEDSFDKCDYEDGEEDEEEIEVLGTKVVASVVEEEEELAGELAEEEEQCEVIEVVDDPLAHSGATSTTVDSVADVQSAASIQSSGADEDESQTQKKLSSKQASSTFIAQQQQQAIAPAPQAQVQEVRPALHELSALATAADTTAQHPQAAILAPSAVAEEDVGGGYQIHSDRDSSGSSDSGTDDDDSDSERKKRIPEWARGTALKEALERQYGLSGHTPIDPDLIFPQVESCSLEDIFGSKGGIGGLYKKRTSSAKWERDQLTDGEIRVYRHYMGLGSGNQEGHSARPRVANPIAAPIKSSMGVGPIRVPIAGNGGGGGGGSTVSSSAVGSAAQSSGSAIKSAVLSSSNAIPAAVVAVKTTPSSTLPPLAASASLPPAPAVVPPSPGRAALPVKKPLNLVGGQSTFIEVQAPAAKAESKPAVPALEQARLLREQEQLRQAEKARVAKERKDAIAARTAAAAAATANGTMRSAAGTATGSSATQPPKTKSMFSTVKSIFTGKTVQTSSKATQGGVNIIPSDP